MRWLSGTRTQASDTVQAIVLLVPRRVSPKPGLIPRPEHPKSQPRDSSFPTLVCCTPMLVNSPNTLWF